MFFHLFSEWAAGSVASLIHGYSIWVLLNKVLVIGERAVLSKIQVTLN